MGHALAVVDGFEEGYSGPAARGVGVGKIVGKAVATPGDVGVGTTDGTSVGRTVGVGVRVTVGTAIVMRPRTTASSVALGVG